MQSIKDTCNTNIIVLITNEFLGDDNNSLGVARALKELQQQATITQYKQNDWSNISIDETQNTIVIGAGEATLETIADLKSKYRNKVFVSWSSHQLPEKKMQEMLDTIDLINLPNGIITTFTERERFKGKLVETNGVPHNLSREDLKEAYEKAKVFLPEFNNDKKRILFVLGGDAPNVQTGQIQCFNDRDIEQVVKYITSLDQEKHQIFIVSSPRTGKYILEVNKHTESAKLIENPTTHRSDKPITEPTDPVSMSLLKLLNDSKIDYSFYDFRYGEVSFFKALLHCCSVAFIPGESTSMISEAKDFTGVIIYTNSAMSKSHTRFVEQISKTYGLKVLNGQILEKSVECKPISTQTAAETVANAIISSLEISPSTPTF